MALWLLPPNRAARVRVLARDIMLCSSEIHMGTSDAGGNPAMDLHPIQGEVEILLVASRYRKLRPDEPLGSYADLT